MKHKIILPFEKNGVESVIAKDLCHILYESIKKKASHDLKVWQIPRYIINFMIKIAVQNMH